MCVCKSELEVLDAVEINILKDLRLFPTISLTNKLQNVILFLFFASSYNKFHQVFSLA